MRKGCDRSALRRRPRAGNLSEYAPCLGSHERGGSALYPAKAGHRSHACLSGRHLFRVWPWENPANANDRGRFRTAGSRTGGIGAGTAHSGSGNLRDRTGITCRRKSCAHSAAAQTGAYAVCTALSGNTDRAAARLSHHGSGAGRGQQGGKVCGQCGGDPHSANSGKRKPAGDTAGAGDPFPLCGLGRSCRLLR